MPSVIEALNMSNQKGQIAGSVHKSIPLIHCNEIVASLITSDFVENLLTVGACSVVYGPSNSGKSFYVLDLAAHVASNKTYRGNMLVEGGVVVYVTLEGQSSFDNRIAALKATGKMSPNAELHVVKVPVDLLEAADCSALIAAMYPLDLFGVVRLVIVDTLSRAMPGGDENSAVDMTALIQSMDHIRKATGAHIMLVHHCGKDEAKGARGHTSLRAAVDTEIEILSAEVPGKIVARVKKQRDLECIPPMVFSLEPIILGTNARGKDVTSCTVRHELECSAPKKVAQGFKKTKMKPSPEDVLNLMPEMGSIHRRVLVSKITNELEATVRDAEAILLEMCGDHTLLELSKKSPSGQRQCHLSRHLDKKSQA
jgi:RecA-family ATPase